MVTPYRSSCEAARGLHQFTLSARRFEVTTKQTSIKPHLEKWRTMISSVEADARLTAQDKEEIFAVLEGLISIPRIRWAQLADKERANVSS